MAVSVRREKERGGRVEGGKKQWISAKSPYSFQDIRSPLQHASVAWNRLEITVPVGWGYNTTDCGLEPVGWALHTTDCGLELVGWALHTTDCGLEPL